MNETKQRIEAYKAALPALKERVIASVLLLAISVSALTSASFAWLTISRAPAVTGVNTTIAANGSLEIALSNAVGTEPGESQVGDSMATEGQSVLVSNQTWGNLINLSDPLYGLANLALRPAQLNTASLLDSPLFGAVYNKDGRITQLTSNFKYATWNPPEGLIQGYFGVSSNYGVRAISSVTYGQLEGAADAAALEFLERTGAVESKNSAAASKYLGLANNNDYMQSLATMMGLYMTARMNDDESLSNPTCDIADIQNLRDMYSAFLDAIELEADALTALVNLQLYLLDQPETFTKEQLYTSTSASLKALISTGDPNKYVLITELTKFVNDRNTIKSDLVKLNALCDGGTSLKWKDSGLNGIVNNLVDVGKCTIGDDNTPISSIGASNAMGYLSGTQEAKITNGILYNFEERTGAHLEVKGLEISATVKRMGMTIPATVKANVSTTASKDYYLFQDDMTHAKSLFGNEVGVVYMAQDTYGMAIDLWVRSNASGSYLTLEGNVLTESETVRATGKDANGNTVELYTYPVTITENGETTTVSKDIYKEVTGSGDDEVVTWKDASTFEEVTVEEGKVPSAKMETIDKVIGYEGVNRIWGDDETLSVDSTSQGSGSCYVYYADTPEDQAQSLKLLEAFKVAFVNSSGKLMATAAMDTDHYYAVSGRVIVPLKLEAGNSLYIGDDTNGEAQYAISELVQNTAQRITAIVYLDGTKLTNDDVLAASDIQGQLNIQFGSSQSLKPIDNEKLQTAERSVTASVSEKYFDYDTHEGPMTTTVKLNINGDQPSTIKAFFMRQINSSQGSREEMMTFTKNEAGAWVSDYTFTTPGKYVLRTVQLDGTEYVLDTCPEVTVEGFDVKTLVCSEADANNHISVMTAGNSHTVNLTLEFATTDASKLPDTVQGRFLRSDGSATNINFTYNTTTNQWTGSATFISSGEYTLQFLVLDGEYMELPEHFWQTATVSLGMKVAVYSNSPRNYTFESKETMPTFDMMVTIMDNEGKELSGLSNVKLTYPMRGSVVKRLDADLTWNGSTGYYEGKLISSNVGTPGIFEFGSVSVDANTITNATTYPVFSVLPPDPPSYDSWSSSTYQYAPNGGAELSLWLANASAVTQAEAEIVDENGNVAVVAGVLGTTTTNSDDVLITKWTFKVPSNESCGQNCDPKCQEGIWTIKKISMVGVIKDDGVSVHDEDDPYVLSIPENQTIVSVHATASFADTGENNIGKEKNGSITADFLETQTVTGLTMDFDVFDTQNIDVIDRTEPITVTYEYSGDSSSHGGYTAESVSSTVTTTFGYTYDETLGKYIYKQLPDTNAQTVVYAGEYVATEVNYTSRDGETHSLSEIGLPVNPPTFDVWSNVATAMKSSETAKLGTSTTQFMVPQSLNWTVDKSVIDFNDVTIPANVQSATVTFDYIGEWETYGGYTTSADLANTVSDVNMTFTYDSTTQKYTGTGSATYAGKYVTKAVSFVFSDAIVKLDSNVSSGGPSFAISSIAPTVTVTGISPTGTYSVDKTTNADDSMKTESQGNGLGKSYRAYYSTDSNHVTGYTPSKDSANATVYYKCDHTDNTKYGYTNYYSVLVGGELTAIGAALNNKDYHQYTQPTVTLTLANKGNAASADLSFGANALVYESAGGTTKTSFKWTTGTTSTRYIGTWTDAGDSANDTKVVAGTITANTLTVTYDGKTYTFTIPTITINNPY